MVFAILYGFFCGCFLSLISAVAAKLYGADRLAGLSGLLLLFNAPGTSLKFALPSLYLLPCTLLPTPYFPTYSHVPYTSTSELSSPTLCIDTDIRGGEARR